MNFSKHKTRLVLISVFLLVVSLELEMRVFASKFPIVSILLFIFAVLVMLQFQLFFNLKEMIQRRFNDFNKSFGQQAKINRNLMFAIEEIIELQRQNKK